MITGYLCDVDGTLLDSMRLWDHLAERYLQKQGIQADPAITNKLTSMTIPQAALYMKDCYDLEKRIEIILNEVYGLLNELYQYEVDLKEGVKEFMLACQAKHIKLCILSANHEQTIRLALQHFGIEDAFCYIMTCEQLNMDKTNPELYHQAIKQFGLPAEECMFVEDSLHAIAYIKEAGYAVLGVYDETNKEDWKEICEISDQTVKSLAQWEV